MDARFRPPVEQATKSNPSRKGAGWLRWLLLAALAAGLVAFFASGAQSYLSFDHFLRQRESLAAYTSAHLAFSLLAYAGFYIAAVALSIPGALLLTVAGGFLFGGWLGGAVTSVAAAIGATCVFLIARSSIGETLAARAGPWLTRLREGFAEDAASYMLFLRLVPVFPFWLVNLAPALLGVPLRTFVWTTFVGVIPATFAYSLAGAGLDSVVLAQKAAYETCVATGQAGCRLEFSFKSLVTRELILAFAAIGVVALIPAGLKRWRSHKTKTDKPE